MQRFIFTILFIAYPGLLQASEDIVFYQYPRTALVEKESFNNPSDRERLSYKDEILLRVRGGFRVIL